jgi:hypothetical protein
MKLSKVKIRQRRSAYTLRSPFVAPYQYGGIKVSRHDNRHPRTKFVSILSIFSFPGNVDSLYSKTRAFFLDTFSRNVALFLFRPESRLPEEWKLLWIFDHVFL